ncbi:energy transducer TonB [uncultured Sphaerochaeta sp.]|uniref:energy transducer TonB n=1 Tax=uncultured Sphaerochaeta sp. TaxID=886478 RepID=UPI0029C9F2AE|nr:energy transducer TonB [uncultured Sphaerochaeta sp.]
MKCMQRVLLIIVLVFLSILILFIPLKRNEGKAVETEEEMTPIAMLSMDRLLASPRIPVETVKESNALDEETISASVPTLPVPAKEKTEKKEETSQRPEQNTPPYNTLEEEEHENPGEDGYYYTIDMVTTRPQFDLSLLASSIVYPTLARRQGKEGTVLLRLFIDEEGKIEQIIVEEDPGYGFADAAIAAFTNFRVAPAIHDDVPVPVTLLYPIRFSLHNE